MYNGQGHYRGQQPNLPFDPEYVDARNKISVRPPLPRMDQLGQMAPYAGDLVDHLIMQVQDNAERNCLRTFAFNYWGEGQFRNDQFLELIYAFGAWIETILMSTANANPAAVIGGEAEAFVSAATAILTEAFPDLRNYIPREADGELHTNLNNWRLIIRDVHAAQRQYGYQGNAGYQGRGGQAGYTGGGAPRQGGGFNRNGAPGGQQNYRRQPEVNVNTLRPSWEMNNQDPVGSAVKRSGYNTGARPSPGAAPAPQVSSSGYKSLRDVVAANVEGDELPMPTQNRQSVLQKAQPVVALNTAAERPFDKVPVSDGRFLVPAYQSPETPAYTPLEPPEVFPRKTHILFYVVSPDGSMKEVIQEKSEIENGDRTVKYLEHEMDEALRKLYKVNTGVFEREIVVPNVTHLKRLIPNKEGTIATKVPEAMRLELDQADAPRQLTRLLQASSLTNAMYMARLELDRMSLDPVPQFLEYQVEESNESLIFVEALPLLLALGRCKNYAEFIELLMRQHQSELAMTDDLFEAIDKRMTATFNRYLAKQMYLEVDLDDFVKDYPDFPDYCTNKYGQPIFDKVLEGQREVIARSVTVLHGDALKSFIKRQPEDQHVKLEESAVFVDRYSVTEVPWTMYEMEREWRLEGVITDHNAALLHAAMTSVFGRTQTNDIHLRILLTRDHQPIFFSRSPVLEEDFVVTTSIPDYSKAFFDKRLAL